MIMIGVCWCWGLDLRLVADLGYGLWVAGCFCVLRVAALTALVFVGAGFWFDCIFDVGV